MQKQLPDLSFLKGAVVPFAAGRAGWTGTACVHLATLAASSPKGIAPPKSPLGLCCAPAVAGTDPSEVFWGPQPFPAAYPQKGSSWKALLLHRQEGRQTVADPQCFPGHKTPAGNSAPQHHHWGWWL